MAAVVAEVIAVVVGEPLSAGGVGAVGAEERGNETGAEVVVGNVPVGVAEVVAVGSPHVAAVLPVGRGPHVVAVAVLPVRPVAHHIRDDGTRVLASGGEVVSEGVLVLLLVDHGTVG